MNDIVDITVQSIAETIRVSNFPKDAFRNDAFAQLMKKVKGTVTNEFFSGELICFDITLPTEKCGFIKEELRLFLKKYSKYATQTMAAAG